MINNRQAGRRRGRNNNNPRQQGGGNRGSGDSGNRIDNRARGNAAQLLEKYRNMARDAHLADDRVNVEYYLQFADHYFRVLADNRARQEEHQQRFQRNDEPIGDALDNGDDGYESMDDSDDRLFGDSDLQSQSNGRDYQNRRNEQGRNEQGRNEQGEDRDNRNRNRDNGRDRDQQSRPNEARSNEARPNEARPNEARNDEGRERNDRNRNRDSGNRRDREDRGPRAAGNPGDNDDRDADEENGLNLAALPPPIGRIAEAPEAEIDAAGAEAPKPRRGRRPRQAEAAE